MKITKRMIILLFIVFVISAFAIFSRINLLHNNKYLIDIDSSVKVISPDEIFISNPYEGYGYNFSMSNNFVAENKSEYSVVDFETFNILVDRNVLGFNIHMNPFLICYDVYEGSSFKCEERKIEDNILINIYKNDKLIIQNRDNFYYKFNFNNFEKEIYFIEFLWQDKKQVKKLVINWLDHDEFEKHKIEYLHNNLSKLLPISNQIIKNNTNLDLENMKLECSYNIDGENKTITTTLSFQLLGKREKSFSYSDLGIEKDGVNNLKCEVMGVEIVEE